ncbi:MAG: endonuclease III [Candidatus Gastranaerophilaceae bacterium]|jgi:endonuclease-3
MINIEKILDIIEKQNLPQSDFVKFMETLDSPFLVLIFCILSLRTKDETTYPASLKLLKLGKEPHDFLLITEEEVQKAIYPVGFYRNKAKNIIKIAKILTEQFDSVLSDNVDELCKLPGVGRKTANLVVAKGFNKPAICVDIHVHRICNRLGYVKTKTPDETEMELRRILPLKYWKKINTLLVTFGQNICRPISPKCSICPVNMYCMYYKRELSL